LIQEPAQRRALRRKRAIASGLLLIMAAVSIATSAIPDRGFWLLLVQASAEAALVGGLADWFAVTALFRRPLGLPIPHTAVVPHSKDRIGEGLAAFFERNFLTQEIMAATLHSVDPARRLADWLSAPVASEWLADHVLHVLPHLIRVADDQAVRGFFTKSLHETLHAVDFSPLLARAMGELAASGYHGTLIDDALKACQDFLDRKEERFEELVAERHRGWIRKSIDRQVARTIVRGVRDLLEDLMQPDSRARQSLLHAIEEKAQEAIAAPVNQMKFDDAKKRFFEHPEVQAWLASIWEKLRDAAIDDIASPSSQARQALAASFNSLALTLSEDPPLCQKLNKALEAVVGEFLPWRQELLDLITQVVKKWDAKAFSERIELAVGSDLQYIRINGTVVGALIGCLLYLAKAIFE
jgi:uncharacterized membrane-anchored protein YjiN (DUF445 family)